MPHERASPPTGAEQELTHGAAEVTSEHDETRPVGERVEELARDRSAGGVQPGDQLGRYMILRPLGSGGMAHVYVAYDPELNREVALKVMRPSASEARDAAGERLLREAQAMARLEHVNVARVYDVGVVDRRVYMAMELVRGDNLEEWLARKRRHYKEIVRVMIRAGRGLAAAHGAGLVHLDFKPRNVMVGDDGEVRVVDFGLARPPRTEDKAPRFEFDNSMDSLPTGRLTDQVTEFGLVMGTPGYMAPEQLTGGLADARTDQFAFCVTMWSALYGRRPFGGKAGSDLNAAVLRARIEPPSPGSRVPGWIRRLLERGLSHRPGERFDSMQALLRALERDPAARRRKAAAAFAACGLIGAAWVWAHRSTGSGPSCDRAIEHLQGVWDDARRADVGRAFARDPRAFARDSLTKIGERLDEYAAAWVQMHDDSCLATHQRGEQSTEMLDLRTRCLMERRMELKAVTDLLAVADETVVEGAVQTVAALPDLAACSDLARLERRGEEPADDATRAKLEAARELTWRARVLDSAGKYAVGLVTVTAALVVAEQTEHPATIADARLAYSGLLTEYGDAIVAERFVHLGLQAAEVAGDDERRANGLIDLVFLNGMMLGKVDDAARWAGLADAAITRVGHPPALRVRLYSNQAALAGSTGDVQRSIALYRKSQEVHEAAGLGRNENLASIYLGIGAAYFWLNRYDEAMPYYDFALRTMEEIAGPDHPRTATSYENIGTLHHAQGRYEEAYRMLMRALEVSEGCDVAPERLGTLYNAIGAALEGLQRYDDAGKWFQRAIRVIDDKGIEIPVLGISLANHAGVLVLQGRPREAIAEYERALSVIRATFVKDAIIYDIFACQKAVAHLDAGELEPALALLPEPIARYEADDPTHDALYRGECRLTLAQALADAEPRDLPSPLKAAARGRTAKEWAEIAERDLRAVAPRSRDGLRRLERLRKREAW